MQIYCSRLTLALSRNYEWQLACCKIGYLLYTSGLERHHQNLAVTHPNTNLATSCFTSVFRELIYLEINKSIFLNCYAGSFRVPLTIALIPLRHLIVNNVSNKIKVAYIYCMDNSLSAIVRFQ